MTVASAQAYEVIRKKISDGFFDAGERLKETELVALCEVSRTPVREALRRLEKDGLVNITPNAGAVVADWSINELVDLCHVRARLEGLAARLAAERRNENDLGLLENSAEKMWDLFHTNVTNSVRRKIAKLNSEFHHAILDAAKSRALAAAASQVIEAPIMLRTFLRYEQTEMQGSVRDHLDIYAAINEQNAELAEALMRGHILSGMRALTNIQKGNGENDSNI